MLTYSPDRSVRVPSEVGPHVGLDHNKVQINEKYGGGFPANVEGLHQLHCLNLVRKAMYYNIDYYREKGEGAFVNDAPIVQKHVCKSSIKDPNVHGTVLTSHQRIAWTSSASSSCVQWILASLARCGGSLRTRNIRRPLLTSTRSTCAVTTMQCDNGRRSDSFQQTFRRTSCNHLRRVMRSWIMCLRLRTCMRKRSNAVAEERIQILEAAEMSRSRQSVGCVAKYCKFSQLNASIRPPFRIVDFVSAPVYRPDDLRWRNVSLFQERHQSSKIALCPGMLLGS